MMKKILSLMVLAALFITSCEDKQDALEPLEAFMADDTPRWVSGGRIEKSEDAVDHIFVVDSGGALFSSAKYKIGRIWDDGADYELIEFTGAPAVGKPTAPSIRKTSGVVELHSLEIVKMEGGRLWIVFRESAITPERRIVQ